MVKQEQETGMALIFSCLFHTLKVLEYLLSKLCEVERMERILLVYRKHTVFLEEITKDLE
jgi:hypothetical protein